MLAEPGASGTPVEVIRDLLGYIGVHRAGDGPFEVFMPTGDPDLDLGRRAANAAAWGAAGVTWWAEDLGPWRWQVDPGGPWPVEDMLGFVRRGPARG